METVVGIIIFIVFAVVKTILENKKKEHGSDGADDSKNEVPLFSKLQSALQNLSNLEEDLQQKKISKVPPPPKVIKRERKEKKQEDVYKKTYPNKKKNEFLQKQATLRKAVVWAEILGKPKGMQD